MSQSLIRCEIVVSALLLAAISTPAYAALGSSYVVARTVDGVQGSSVVFCNSRSTTGAQIGCNGSQEINGTTYFYDGAVKAEDYGVLKGRGFSYASRSLPPGTSTGPNERLATEFGALFDDSFVVASGVSGAHGTAGTFQLGFAMTGSTYNSGGNLLYWSMYLHNLSTGEYVAMQSQLPATLTLSTSITYGQSFDYRVGLVGSFDLNEVQRGGYDQQQASIDLFNTARLIFVRGLDGSGSEVPISITALSGNTYQGVLPVPETPIWLTMSIGLLGLGCSRRFARQG